MKPSLETVFTTCVGLPIAPSSLIPCLLLFLVTPPLPISVSVGDQMTHHLLPGAFWLPSTSVLLVPGCSQEMGPPMSNSAPKPAHSIFPRSPVFAAAASFPRWPLNWHWPHSRSQGEAVTVQAPPGHPVQGPEQPSLPCGRASLLPDTSITFTSDFRWANSLFTLDYLGVQTGNALY